ncbi:MAG: response regulator [Chitinophagaceae bacterium]|nr:response regulator [Chitinophagaceae bacterium]
MSTPLPITNWSLRRALQTLPGLFERARVRIIFILLAFAVAKALSVVGVSLYKDQPEQMPRGIAALVCYIILMKALLSYPSRLRLFSHIMLVAGLVLIWSNIFVYTLTINLITLQFVFMAILGSFYTLGSRAGIIYTFLSVLPVMIFIFMGGDRLPTASTATELASPGFEIMATLNFLTIAFAHYYFFKAFDSNIKEKEKLNAQLLVSAAEAQKVAETRTNFLATMSHELRTPLNSVIGLTELMSDDQRDQPQKENLDILRNSALDLLSLINNILDINKLDSGKLQLENVPFPLYQLINNVCSVLKVKARDKQLDLVLETDDAIKDLHVVSDPTRLSQVLYNLVGNAIKFTEKGSVTVHIELVQLTSDHAEVLISIADTGIGIHPDRHLRIFDTFTQAEANTTRKYGGTGLGLSIVQQVLSLFNSGIELESKPGEGSNFFFRIMFQTVSASRVEDIPAKQNSLDHLRILVAEDNDVNKLVLQQQLDNLKVRSVMVADGKAAYDACMAGDYDAVLLDLDMPGWDGYETTKQIRSHNDPGVSNAYLIAFTASVSEEKQIIENGFNDFLYKPVSMKDLRQKLEKVALRHSA